MAKFWENVGELIGAAFHGKAMDRQLEKANDLDRQGYHSDAVSIYERVIDSCPSWMDSDEYGAYAWKDRGQNLTRSGYYREAVRSFDKAYRLAEKPGLIDAIRTLRREAENRI